MAKKVDATRGNLVKLIFVYTIPLIFSTILQNLFTLADKAVLGNLAGSVAVASIGTTSVVTSLIINGAVGLSTGTAIILARFIGQKDTEKIQKTINTSLLTGIMLGAVVAVAGFLFAPAFLRATGCPAECFEGAATYTRVYLAAAPATLLYNYGAAILRTLGDTKKPLLYITISGVLNVVLNIILCLILPQKVLAVAIATAASNLLSAILVLRRISHFNDIDFRFVKMRFHVGTFWQLLRFGIPASISMLVLPLGNLQIVTAINSFGVDGAAGNAAAVAVQAIASAFSDGFAAAVTTFMGQNIGAGNIARTKRSFWFPLGFNVLISGTLGVFFYLTGRFWLGMIVGRAATAAIDYGMQRLFYVTLFTFIAAINATLSHALQAFGYPLFTSITNIAFTLGFRILWMQLIYPKNPVFGNVMLCFLVSWILNMMLYTVFFTIVYIRYIKTGKCKKI